MPQSVTTFELLPVRHERPARNRERALAKLSAAGLLAFAGFALAGCGNSGSGMQGVQGMVVTPGDAAIDTGCTGCNAHTAQGVAVEQFSVRFPPGLSGPVDWSIAGGDPVSGPGLISKSGKYTPPSYLTADSVNVRVTATLHSNPAVSASNILTVSPGFLQPLAPQNAALGPGGAMTFAGTLAESGGSASIHFSLAGTPGSASQGALSAVTCSRSSQAFTTCSVTYTAPSTISGSGVTSIIASTGPAHARVEAAILLNATGVSSSALTHQDAHPSPALLGASGGNNNDFDVKGNTVVDCCSGTLGALVEDSAGRQYLLSNNHVLARSDQASVGDTIVQPGLIDNNCTPNGDGPGTMTVGALTGWLPLSSDLTNVDAAIAQVASHSVDSAGRILELGPRLANGTLAAAPPGITSSGGKGEAPSLALQVAKSGRTTGLTCGQVSAIDVDVQVDYYTDCAETHRYLTKTFTHQFAISGNRFSDAGDSGALVVDSANAEPVGLYFAGGIDSAGVSQGMANPAGEVLRELSTQLGAGMTYSFVGAADHAVSCLNFGNSSVASAQQIALSDSEIKRVQSVLAAARQLVRPSAGVLGVAMGKSSDRPGEAAVIVYVASGDSPSIPQTINNARTVVVPTTEEEVALGTAAMSPSLNAVPALSAASLSRALAVKAKVAPALMRNPAFFAVGVGQSLDNPREPCLIVYVDRSDVPPALPASTDGIRMRYIFMDRLHVTRAYAGDFTPRRHCMPHSTVRQFDPDQLPMNLPRF